MNMGLVDIDALADTIGEAYSDVKGRKAKGKAARKWVEANMTWDIIAKQFHELIEDTIERGLPLGMD